MIKIQRIGLSIGIIGCVGILVAYLDPRADIIYAGIITTIGFTIFTMFE